MPLQTTGGHSLSGMRVKQMDLFLHALE